MPNNPKSTKPQNIIKMCNQSNQANCLRLRDVRLLRSLPDQEKMKAEVELQKLSRRLCKAFKKIEEVAEKAEEESDEEDE